MNKEYTVSWDGYGERACVVSPNGYYYAAVEARCLMPGSATEKQREDAVREAVSRASKIAKALYEASL